MPDIVVGHLVMMIIALIVAHGASILARRSADERRALIIRLVGIVLALVIIVGGIMALGRSVIGSAPMTVGLGHEAGQVTSGSRPVGPPEMSEAMLATITGRRIPPGETR